MVAALAVACELSSPAEVDFHGQVLLTICGGTEPANPPPGWQACSTHAVPGATVLIAPMQGSVLTMRTDGEGNYSIRLTPATYVVAAYGTSENVSFFSPAQWVGVQPGKQSAWPIYAQFNEA